MSKRAVRVRSLAIPAGVLGVVLLVMSYGLATVGDFRLAYDRCTYAALPSGALRAEGSLVDSFASAVPIGYGCTWTAPEGGTVSSTITNWSLTTGAGLGLLLVVVAGFALSRAALAAVPATRRIAPGTHRPS